MLKQFELLEFILADGQKWMLMNLVLWGLCSWTWAWTFGFFNARKAANPQVEPKIFHILVFPSFSSFIFLQRSLQIKQELLKNQILIFFVLFIQFVLIYS